MTAHPFANVRIKDIRLNVLIGTRPEERLSPQDVVVNIVFDYDAALAIETDAIGHAVDYAALHDRIVTSVATTRFALLERLAGYIIDLVMSDVRVVSATVSVEKQKVLSHAQAVVVEVSAARNSSSIEGQPKKTTRCY